MAPSQIWVSWILSACLCHKPQQRTPTTASTSPPLRILETKEPWKSSAPTIAHRTNDVHTHGTLHEDNSGYWESQEAQCSLTLKITYFKIHVSKSNVIFQGNLNPA